MFISDTNEGFLCNIYGELVTRIQVYNLFNSLFVSLLSLAISLFEVDIFVSSAESTNF